MPRLSKVAIATEATNPQLAEAEIFRVIGPFAIRFAPQDSLCWSCFTWIKPGVRVFEVRFRRQGTRRGEQRAKFLHADCFDEAKRTFQKRQREEKRRKQREAEA